MKKILLILFLVSTCINAQVFLDTLTVRSVGPGVQYIKINAPSVPWNIDILKVDLKNPHLKLETVKAKDRAIGLETVLDMSKRKTYEGHYVAGAINADYFDVSNGKMTNIQIGKGEILRAPVHSSVIGFDINNRPMLGFVTFNGQIFSGDSSSKIDNINAAPAADKMVLFNSYFGTSTGTSSVTEALISPVGDWSASDTMKCVVESVSSAGSMTIPEGKAVLSASGIKAQFITNNLHAGDTIRVYQGIGPAFSKLREMIGGRPKIVYNGVNYLEKALKQEAGSSTYTREPRTAAGFTADSTTLYLLTLDGRMEQSAGATLSELADLMVRLGIYHGINLDGGGSSTLVARNELMNIPSGGGVQRAVGNGFIVVSSAPPAAGALVKIALPYPRKKVFIGEQKQLTVFGYDQYNNPASYDTTLLKYSMDPGLGTIDSKGLFTASGKAAKGFVYVKYNNFSDSTYIIVKPVSRLDVTPKNIVLDTLKTLKLSITGYDMDNLLRTVTAGQVTWKSSNSLIAAVDSDGVVRGRSEGKVKIIAEMNPSVADTIEVTVQVGKDLMLVNALDNNTGWSISGVNVDTSATKLLTSTAVKTQGTGSLAANYKFTYDPAKSYMLYLDTDIPVYGIPDSLFISTQCDSGITHKLSLVFADDNNELYRLNAFGYINSSDKFNRIPVPMKNFAPLGSGIFFYPVRVTRLEITLMYNTKKVAGQTYSGTIYLDNLLAKYPVAPTGVEENKTSPAEYSLKQNYPNPFNPSTVIEFSTAREDNVSLRVYDILGREVALLVNGRLSAGVHKAVWNASGNASGIYFYRLQSGSYTETKKMLLVR